MRKKKLANNKKKKKRTWCRLHRTQCNYICCNRPLLQKKLVIWIYLSNIFSSNIFSSSIHTLRIHSFIDSCINGFEFSFAKVCFAQCSTSRLALGSPGCSVGCSLPCPEYLIKPYNDIFLKSPGSKDIKTDIPNCQIPKYTNTQIQIHKYTNTAYDEMPEIPNICCIFEQLVVQGCQKWYSRDPRSTYWLQTFALSPPGLSELELGILVVKWWCCHLCKSRPACVSCRWHLYTLSVHGKPSWFQHHHHHHWYHHQQYHQHRHNCHQLTHISL